MAVRYLNATGTQALINEIKSRLALKADLTSLQALQQALDTVAASIPTNLSQLSNDADFVTATQVGDTYATKASVTELSGIVSQNQTAINLLNANDQTQGSVDYKIAQALSSAGTPFYDTALPGSIPGWLAQLPAGANLASMHIHPTADVNQFKANRHYFAWMMKFTMDGATVWMGIALGSWTGAQSRVQKALYEIEADTNNYVALSNALTGGDTKVLDVYHLAAESEIPEYFLGRCDIYDSLTITTDQGRDKWFFERTGAPVSFYKETAYSIVSEPFVVPITSERKNLAAVGQAIYRVRGRLENGAWTITPTRLYTERSIFNYEIEELFV